MKTDCYKNLPQIIEDMDVAGDGWSRWMGGYEADIYSRFYMGIAFRTYPGRLQLDKTYCDHRHHTGDLARRCGEILAWRLNRR